MGRRVLVVEPVAARGRSFVQALEERGFDAVSVGSLADALELARATPADVLVLDARATEPADGFRALRVDGALKDAVVLASCSDVRRTPELIARGAHGVIGKPVTERSLVKAVAWALDVYRSDDALEPA